MLTNNLSGEEPTKNDAVVSPSKPLLDNSGANLQVPYHYV